jgi:hypothetical protein
MITHIRNGHAEHILKLINNLLEEMEQENNS